jgi:hypothetical protein
MITTHIQNVFTRDLAIYTYKPIYIYIHMCAYVIHETKVIL